MSFPEPVETLFVTINNYFLINVIKDLILCYLGAEEK